MSKVYSVEVLICATAYISAESPEEAARIATENFREHEDASTSDRSFFGDVPVSGATFDDLPDVSLSPAMTFLGYGGGNRVTFKADDMSEAG